MKGEFPVLDKMRSSTVYICGLARDVADKIPRLKAKVEHLGCYFKDYRIFIYENDSVDGTVDFLKGWSDTNERVSFMSRKLDIPRLTDLSERRISRVSEYRNECLKQMWQSYYADMAYDYTIVIDWDIYTFCIDGIIDSISYDRWDAMASNGRSSVSLIRTDDVYYDAFAHEDDSERLIRPKKIMAAFREIQQNYSKLQPGHSIVPVESAFNGLAIYKTKSLRNCKYGVVPGYAEHAYLHRDMTRQGKDNIFINPNQLVMYDKSVFLKYLRFFENDGLTAPTSSV